MEPHIPHDQLPTIEYPHHVEGHPWHKKAVITTAILGVFILGAGVWYWWEKMHSKGFTPEEQLQLLQDTSGPIKHTEEERFLMMQQNSSKKKMKQETQLELLHTLAE